MVIEDMDGSDSVGAFWGEVNAKIHKKFGLTGALTNGVMRDLDGLPEHFPIIAGSIGPSHCHVHVKSFGEPVSVFGLTVKEGDFIHADRHGAIIIPPELFPVLEGAIAKLIEIESTILGPVAKDVFSFEDLQEAWAEFETLRV